MRTPPVTGLVFVATSELFYESACGRFTIQRSGIDRYATFDCRRLDRQGEPLMAISSTFEGAKANAMRFARKKPTL